MVRYYALNIDLDLRMFPPKPRAPHSTDQECVLFLIKVKTKKNLAKRLHESTQQPDRSVRDSALRALYPLLFATYPVQAFNSLATQNDLRRRMMEQGAASAIIALAASSHSAKLRSECVEALCKLAVWPGSEAQVIAEVGEDKTSKKKVCACRHRHWLRFVSVHGHFWRETYIRAA